MGGVTAPFGRQLFQIVPPPARWAVTIGVSGTWSRVSGVASRDELVFHHFSADEVRSLGRWFVPMLLHWNHWVHRRVTTLSFLNERRLSRHVSIDFTIPKWRQAPELSLAAGLRAIPVTFLEKRHAVLSGVNIYDEFGRALPVMVTQDTWCVGRAMLEDLFRVAAQGAPLSLAQVGRIQDIVCTEPTRAHDAVAHLVTELSARGETGIYEPAQSAFAALASDMADKFLLVAMLPGSPGERRVIKFEYEDECQVAYRHEGGAAADGRRERLALALRSWPRSMAVQAGLAPLPIVLGVRDVAYALSYHIEIPSPDGLFFLRAAIEKGEGGRWVSLERTGACERAHLYLYNQHRSIETRLDVEFRMQAGDWPAVGLTSAALTFAILLAGAVLHEFFGRHPDIGGAAAVPAVLPGVLAAMYLRSGEHPILRWMVRGIRLMVVALITISLASAGSLAVRPGLPVSVWLVLTLVSLVLLCLMIVTFAVSLRSRTSTREATGASGT